MIERTTLCARATARLRDCEFGYTYDSTSRISALRHVSVSLNQTVDLYTYRYDLGDRYLGINSQATGDASFAYDKRDQLVTSNRAVTNDRDEQFQYDSAGNRQLASLGGNAAISSFGTSFQHNRLQNVGVYAYAYDQEGNVVSKTRSGEHIRYTWDHRNRLTQVRNSATSTSPVTTQVDLLYDAKDRMVRYTVDADGAGSQTATVRNFVYNGNELAMELDASNFITHRYLGGSGQDDILADETQVFDPATYLSSKSHHLLLTDHQGSVRTIIDGTVDVVGETTAGTVVQRLDYDSFGEVIGATPANVLPTTGNNNGGINAAAVDTLFGYS